MKITHKYKIEGCGKTYLGIDKQLQHQRCHNVTKVHLVKPKKVRGNLISKKKIS